MFFIFLVNLFLPALKLFMDLLKVGDKVYTVKRDGFADFARYSFSEVERLTKTLAVLKNGVRLVNKPRESFIMEDVGYSVARDYGKHWHKVSLKAIREAQLENAKIRVHEWFEQRTFSLAEKQLIHKQFEELNMLYPKTEEGKIV